MSTRKAVVIECDQCGRGFIVHDVTRHAARRFAAQRGWDLGRGPMADICPVCVAEASR
jgi:hypothetical protein